MKFNKNGLKFNENGLNAGNAVSQGAEQGDDQRRCCVDHHQHRQGRIPILRRNGSRPQSRHARPHRPLITRNLPSTQLQSLTLIQSSHSSSTIVQWRSISALHRSWAGPRSISPWREQSSFPRFSFSRCPLVDNNHVTATGKTMWKTKKKKKAE